MGVEGFYGRWLAKKYPDAVKKTLPNGNDLFLETLTFDMGGVMHRVAQEIYSYGEHYKAQRSKVVAASLATEEGRQILMTSFCTAVTNRITELTKSFINEVNPEYKRVTNLVIAMDGCAPFAKVAQQRTRRYKSAIPSEESDEPDSKKKFVPPPSGWHPNALTPGTKLMLMFDAHLKLWASGTGLELVQEKLIVSTSQERGEGEHKLFDFRREKRYSQSEKGIVGVYGLDADIIMLESIFKSERVYMIREKNSQTHRDEGFGDHAGIVDIDQYRLELIKSMTGIEDCGSMHDTNFYGYIRDFVLMTFLIGNDFLPHILFIHDVPKALDMVIDVYRNVIYGDENTSYSPKNKHLTKGDGSINWRSLLALLRVIRKEEIPELGVIASMVHNSTPKSEINPRYESVRLSTIMKHFPSAKGKEPKTTYTVDFDSFRGFFYADALGPKTASMRDFLMYEDIVPFAKEEVMDMCNAYIGGLQWIIMYYTLGTSQISRSWYYPYTQSPTLSDIYDMLKYMVKNNTAPGVAGFEFYEGDPNFGPVHQLLTVMPPKTFDLIDEKFSSLLGIRDGFGPLTYIAPLSFSVDKEGTKKSHQGLAMLPTIDPAEIVRCVKEVKTVSRGQQRMIEGQRSALQSSDEIYRGIKEDETVTFSAEHDDPIKYEPSSRTSGKGGYRKGGSRPLITRRSFRNEREVEAEPEDPRPHEAERGPRPKSFESRRSRNERKDPQSREAAEDRGSRETVLGGQRPTSTRSTGPRSVYQQAVFLPKK